MCMLYARERESARPCQTKSAGGAGSRSKPWIPSHPMRLPSRSANSKAHAAIRARACGQRHELQGKDTVSTQTTQHLIGPLNTPPPPPTNTQHGGSLENRTSEAPNGIPHLV